MLKAVKIFLVLLFLTLVLLFSLLFSGIKIDSFSLGNLNVSQFYIKLNKKLIVEIEQIAYKSRKSKENKGSFESLKQSLELFPNIIKYFETIYIERLKLKDNEFTIFLDDKSLYLDSKYLNLSSKLDFQGSRVILDMYSLYLKDIELMLDGKISVDYFEEKLNYYGEYFYHDLQGDIKLDMDKKLARFYINSDDFKSLRFIKKYADLSLVAESWMYDNVKGDIKLDFLYGQIDLEKKRLIERSLYGKAQVKKAKIKFHKDLEPIITKRVDLDFDNGNLIFDLKEPKYANMDINGSTVVIRNLTSQENGVVNVNIKSKKIRLNNDILNILKAYKINLPVNQISGYTRADLLLEIPYKLDKGMRTTGLFEVFDSNIKIGDFDFYTKDARVILDGPIVKLRDADFKYLDLVQSEVNMDLDTRTLKASGIVDIDKLLIESKKEEILKIQKSLSDLELDFNDPIKIDLVDFDSSITIDENINIRIDDLSKLYKNSEVLKAYNISEGNLSIKYVNNDFIDFKGFIKGIDYPVYEDEKQVTSLDIVGQIRKDRVAIQSKDNKVKISTNNKSTDIYLKDFYVDLTKFDDNSSNSENSVLNIKGESLRLKVDEKSIYDLNSLSAKVLSKEDIQFSADVKNLDLPIKKDDKKVTSLSINGNVTKDKVSIETKQRDLFLTTKANEELTLDLNGYDLLYSSKNEGEEKANKFKKIDIKAKNSTLIYNDEFRFLGDTYEVSALDKKVFFHLKHNSTDITYKEDNGKVDIFANDIDDEFINELFGKKIFKGGKVMFVANGDVDSKLSGKVILSNTKIEDLAVINNLLIFIHSSPALINPLLAIPSVVGMASKKGFNLNGYRIVDGVIEFDYDRKKDIINAHKIVTVGNGIDFDGKAIVDLDNSTINSDMKLIFFKDYSSIVSSVPVLNYVLLGENKRVSTKVNIFGDINNPKIKTNLTKDAFSVPLNIGKRILESPAKFLEFLGDGSKEESTKESE